ncbi:MAG: SUMF1/EgtB/PvdO family nonheme iron enzyme [Planctomycetaceae bacterium]|nr:SUMF1/EgtB/PvdO family nonheme iron enzyme [Planctomycetaceae bacterium]
MKTTLSASAVILLLGATFASADTFGTGANQFIIDFVPISGDASSANGTSICQYTSSYTGYKAFSDPGDFRMGTYEITREQWTKFVNLYGTPVGNPTDAYRFISGWTVENFPVTSVSWHEAAQFVNWLNTSAGHQAAYKFTGILGTQDYTFVPWSNGDIGYNTNNPYRNSNAYYFIPTEDEWVKAAYWNGISLQTYATTDNTTPVAGVDTNYKVQYEPWAVGSGCQELNGTYDMMGNVWEWMENPFHAGDYTTYSGKGFRGGSYQPIHSSNYLRMDYRNGYSANAEQDVQGFRVASIPEPGTMGLLAFGAVMLRKRVKGKRQF